MIHITVIHSFLPFPTVTKEISTYRTDVSVYPLGSWLLDVSARMGQTGISGRREESYFYSHGVTQSCLPLVPLSSSFSSLRFVASLDDTVF